jgi:NAD-dependent SIR2 family protein deacetylase
VTAELDAAAAVIAAADGILVCAGAGMGVDSGLPDFRGDHGFWQAYPPYERLGLRFVELADPMHFVDDPTLAWGFYGHRLSLYRSTVPHAGFGLLLGWGKDVRVFTSNVDGQFQSAGFRHVAEVHGSIHHLQCVRPCSPDIWPATEQVTVDPTTMRAVGPLPTCRSCGALARPNILMFGDGDWVPDRSEVELAALALWQRDKRLAVLEIGAGTAVPTVRYYASRFPDVIRINPQAGSTLRMGALAALSALDSRLR